MSAQPISILRSCDRAKVAEMRARGEFFWVDLALADGASAADIAGAFDVSQAAANKLELFAAGGSPAHRMHVEEGLIVFPFWCDAGSDAANGGGEGDEEGEPLNLFRVNVLLHGDFLITMHEARLDLPDLVAEGRVPAGRSERYVVYVALDGMTNTVLETLAAMEGEISDLETRLMESGLRTSGADQARIRSLRTRLTTLRLRIGPERGLFERVGEEIEQVSSLRPDRHQYFERIQGQLDRAVDRIDAASQALSNALQVKLNETTYRLTIVATIFLPLTFLTGFFGMNFAWMVGEIDSVAAFWLLGVGSLLVAVVVLAVLLLRGRAVPE
jgi:magnesium transporter